MNGSVGANGAKKQIPQVPGFTSRYRIHRLVHHERFGDIRNAIAREKEIKDWTRAKKIALIEAKNPAWQDLAEQFFPRTPRMTEEKKEKADPSLRSGSQRGL